MCGKIERGATRYTDNSMHVYRWRASISNTSRLGGLVG